MQLSRLWIQRSFFFFLQSRGVGEVRNQMHYFRFDAIGKLFNTSCILFPILKIFLIFNSLIQDNVNYIFFLILERNNVN